MCIMRCPSGVAVTDKRILSRNRTSARSSARIRHFSDKLMARGTATSEDFSTDGIIHDI